MKLYVSTKNQHKLVEIKAILDSYEILTHPNLQEIEETGKTFEENSALKSVFLSKLVDGYVIADDSGLAVDELGGEPGIYSARYSGANATDDKNVTKLLHGMDGIKNRAAQFICAISLAKNGKLIKTFTGVLNGSIALARKGDNGFGYDPIFVVNGKHVAELTSEEKNAMSHRKHALILLKKYLDENI